MSSPFLSQQNTLCRISLRKHVFASTGMYISFLYLSSFFFSIMLVTEVSFVTQFFLCHSVMSLGAGLSQVVEGNFWQQSTYKEDCPAKEKEALRLQCSTAAEGWTVSPSVVSCAVKLHKSCALKLLKITQQVQKESCQWLILYRLFMSNEGFKI